MPLTAITELNHAPSMNGLGSLHVFMHTCMHFSNCCCENNIKTLCCRNDNNGSLVAAGLLSLSRGNLSFPKQIGTKQYRMQFSYCLVSLGSDDASFITFGQTQESSKPRLTPMIHDEDTDYYVELTGISVDRSKVQGVNSSISLIPRGVIIDSSTFFTRLEESAYNKVRDAFRNATDKLNLAWVPPPTEFVNFVDTCYNFSGVEWKALVPTVLLHFDGVDMELVADNCLVRMDDNGTFCFAFAPSADDGISRIGNVQQQGFGMMFDLETSQIGITPKSC